MLYAVYFQSLYACSMPDLREGVSTTENSLSAVYSDDSMNTTVYHLHAVLVHQGQASGGHYWSYVRKPPSLHVETTPNVQATPPTVEVTGVTVPKLSQTVSNSDTVSSPAMSTESGGGDGEQGKGGGEREDGRGPVGVEEGKKSRDPPSTEECGKKDEEAEGGVWLKFNDVSVYEVGWAEVVKESYGGHHNTSAYCLIYLSPQLHDAWANNGELMRSL